MNPLESTDLPWWLALVTMIVFFVDSFRRRYQSGVVRPWLRTSAAELVMNGVGVYVVFGLPQISDTILTSPPWGMLGPSERWGGRTDPPARAPRHHRRHRRAEIRAHPGPD
jgi:hypothetical protein